MKKTMFSAASLAAVLSLAGMAVAQAPSGGADAKGNAPLKHVHTINDGGAKRGATSFTETQARKHIENAGYSAVSALTKGKDGVWRGAATKDGTAMKIGLDFKGNIVEAGPAADGVATGETHGAMPLAATSAAPQSPSAMGSNPATRTAAHKHRRSHHHRRHGPVSCANPGPNGAACSGVDRNKNGISDKEDRAIKAGAKP